MCEVTSGKILWGNRRSQELPCLAYRVAYGRSVRSQSAESYDLDIRGFSVTCCFVVLAWQHLPSLWKPPYTDALDQRLALNHDQLSPRGLQTVCLFNESRTEPSIPGIPRVKIDPPADFTRIDVRTDEDGAW